jgi:hypothetical protein
MQKTVGFERGDFGVVYPFIILDSKPILASGAKHELSKNQVLAQRFVPRYGFVNHDMMERMSNKQVGIEGVMDHEFTVVDKRNIIKGYEADFHVANCAMDKPLFGAIAVGVRVGGDGCGHQYSPFKFDKLIMRRLKNNKALKFTLFLDEANEYSTMETDYFDVAVNINSPLAQPLFEIGGSDDDDSQVSSFASVFDDEVCGAGEILAGMSGEIDELDVLGFQAFIDAL